MIQKAARGQVGLLCEEEPVSDSLSEVLHHGGFRVLSTLPVSGAALPDLQADGVEAWIVVPPNDAAAAAQLEALLKRAGVRYHLESQGEMELFGEAFIRWQDRLLQDVTTLLGQPKPEPEIVYTRPAARPQCAAPDGLEILVLASSLGGPPAVKAFLDGLRPGLPFPLLYAQHIEPEQLESLARVLARHSHYQLRIGQAGDVVTPGVVTLVPVAERLDVTGGGILRNPGCPWSGPYRPCLDEVIDAVTAVYGARAGVVVFSGMGDDGSRAAARLERSGGRVWAQDAASSGCSSMPDATRAYCQRPYSGPPTALASNLSLLYARA